MLWFCDLIASGSQAFAQNIQFNPVQSPSPSHKAGRASNAEFVEIGYGAAHLFHQRQSVLDWLNPLREYANDFHGTDTLTVTCNAAAMGLSAGNLLGHHLYRSILGVRRRPGVFPVTATVTAAGSTPPRPRRHRPHRLPTASTPPRRLRQRRPCRRHPAATAGSSDALCCKRFPARGCHQRQKATRPPACSICRSPARSKSSYYISANQSWVGLNPPTAAPRPSPRD